MLAQRLERWSRTKPTMINQRHMFTVIIVSLPLQRVPDIVLSVGYAG